MKIIVFSIYVCGSSPQRTHLKGMYVYVNHRSDIHIYAYRILMFDIILVPLQHARKYIPIFYTHFMYLYIIYVHLYVMM